MHKQTGYQSARPTTGVFIAILHGTVVLLIDGDKISVAHGGWVTRSTVKAINGAFKDAGLRGYRANIKRGVLIVTDDNGLEQVIDS